MSILVYLINAPLIVFVVADKEQTNPRKLATRVDNH